MSRIKELIEQIEHAYQLHGVSLVNSFNQPLSKLQIDAFSKEIETVIGYPIPDAILQLYSIGNGDEYRCPALFPWCCWFGMEFILDEYKTLQAYVASGEMFQGGFLFKNANFYEANYPPFRYIEEHYDECSSIDFLLPIGVHSDPGWLFVDLSEKNYGRLLLTSVIGDDSDLIAPSLEDYLSDIAMKIENKTYKFNPDEQEFDMPVSWYEKLKLN